MGTCKKAIVSTTKTPSLSSRILIVIPLFPSVPNPELKGHHLKSEKELAAELKRSDDAKGCDTYSK